MRIILFALLALLSFTNHVQAKNIWDTHPEWFTCQEDNQCALSCEVCGNVSLNKNAIAHAAEVKPRCGQAIPCLPETVAQCMNNQCVAVIDKTSKDK